jgi:hypothetical protein
MRLRYDLRNGVRLCFYCHTGGKFAAHNDPLNFILWLKNIRPSDFEYLMQVRGETVTTTVEWYQDNIERLTKILENNK